MERACELVELLDAGDVLDDVIIDDHSSPNKTNSSEPNGQPFPKHSINSRRNDVLKKIDCQFDEYHFDTYLRRFGAKADIAEEIASTDNRIPVPLRGSLENISRQKFEDKFPMMLALGLRGNYDLFFSQPQAYDKIGMPGRIVLNSVPSQIL
ncbi:MAG: hypothetical protein ACLSCV_06550 [Acutalibacteraceae bacterium]